MASSANPNAMATPTLPITDPASTALPTPANTSTNVPKNSAVYFCILSPNGHQSWPTPGALHRRYTAQASRNGASVGNPARNARIRMRAPHFSTPHQDFQATDTFRLGDAGLQR